MKRINLRASSEAPPEGPEAESASTWLPVPVRFLVLVIALTLYISGSSPAYGAPNVGPGAKVRSMVDRAVAVLKDRQTPLPERRRELHQLVAEHFDFAHMARSALGYHWKELSQDQRREFVPLFTAFMEDSYLGKIQDYSNLKVEIISQTESEPHYTQVNTRALQEGRDPIGLNFYLTQESGGWKVYDVTIDGISIIGSYRNQFSRVINKYGFDTLMNDLRKKQEQLAALLAK